MRLITRKIYRRVSLTDRRIVTPVTITGFLLVSSIVFMLILTVLETASMAGNSFRVPILEQRLNELKSDNTILESEISHQEAMTTLNGETQGLPMFKISNVEYLVPKENIVVAK